MLVCTDQSHSASVTTPQNCTFLNPGVGSSIRWDPGFVQEVTWSCNLPGAQLSLWPLFGTTWNNVSHSSSSPAEIERYFGEDMIRNFSKHETNKFPLPEANLFNDSSYSFTVPFSLGSLEDTPQLFFRLSTQIGKALFDSPLFFIPYCEFLDNGGISCIGGKPPGVNRPAANPTGPCSGSGLHRCFSA